MSDASERFDGLAGDYARYRPSYPSELVDALVDGLPSGGVVADVGAGTGIVSRLLGDRGVDVVAIEPGEDMRRAAEVHERVRWVDATAEDTGVESASVDLVVAAQAMHWFDAERAVAEFARMLRTGGRLAIAWNLRDIHVGFGAHFQSVMLEHGDVEVLMKSADDRGAPALPGFGPVDRLEWRHEQRMDLDGVLGRARSASYAPKNEPARSVCFEALTRGFHEHADDDGRCSFPYRAVLYRAVRL